MKHLEPTSSEESAVRGVISCDFFNLSFHRFFVPFSMVFPWVLRRFSVLGCCHMPYLVVRASASWAWMDPRRQSYYVPVGPVGPTGCIWILLRVLLDVG